MIDTDKYEGHTPAPWNVSRGQRNTVMIEAGTWGCHDCGNTNIYTHENTDGRELCFPNSVEPEPFVMPDEDERGRPMCYCEPCDLMHWASKLDATQNDTDLELIADAPLLLEAYKRLRELLYAIHWDPFAQDDTTLEIDRAVAERIRGGVEE